MKAHFSLFPFILNVHHNQLDTLTFSIKNWSLKISVALNSFESSVL